MNHKSERSLGIKRNFSSKKKRRKEPMIEKKKWKVWGKRKKIELSEEIYQGIPSRLAMKEWVHLVSEKEWKVIWVLGEKKKDWHEEKGRTMRTDCCMHKLFPFLDRFCIMSLLLCLRVNHPPKELNPLFHHLHPLLHFTKWSGSSSHLRDLTLRLFFNGCYGWLIGL